jgi:hypothetical protein
MTKPIKEIVTKLQQWQAIDDKVRWFIRNFPDRPFYTFITTDYQIRTINQNNYYFGVVIPAIQNFYLELNKENIPAKKIHKELKNTFAKGKVFLIGEDDIKIGRSTATATTREFNEYLECIWAWYAKEGLIIPKPNELVFINDKLLF